MPRGPALSWTAAAPHTLEAKRYVEAAYRLGYEIQLTWAGIPTQERAADLKRGLHNAARLHKPRVSVSTEIEHAGHGNWRIKFTLHDKRQARAYIVQKHGADRSRWPYNPRAS